MTDLARRAFRRPVTRARGGEVRRPGAASAGAGALARGRAGGRDPGAARLAGFPVPHRAAIVRRAAGQDAVAPISQHELATRLSYFLWASMPDDRCGARPMPARCAIPAVLDRAGAPHAARPEGAARWRENFGGQWLQFRALESTTRDRERFPDFEDYLRLSMRRETELFVEHVVRDDRSILDFIDGRYSFLNERLARHYGIPGRDRAGVPARRLIGDAARRRADAGQRADGVVVRDADVAGAARQVGARQPAQRAAAAAAAPTCRTWTRPRSARRASMREQLEEHRKDPTCASCHRRMDPLGFGLENFDAVGAWRTMDGKFPIDATGTLPDGDTFNGPEELARDPRRQDASLRARA